MNNYLSKSFSPSSGAATLALVIWKAYDTEQREHFLEGNVKYYASTHLCQSFSPLPLSSRSFCSCFTVDDKDRLLNLDFANIGSHVDTLARPATAVNNRSSFIVEEVFFVIKKYQATFFSFLGEKLQLDWFGFGRESGLFLLLCQAPRVVGCTFSTKAGIAFWWWDKEEKS